MTVGAGAVSSRLAAPVDTPVSVELAKILANADRDHDGQPPNLAAAGRAVSRVAAQHSNVEAAKLLSSLQILAAEDHRIVTVRRIAREHCGSKRRGIQV